MPNPKRRHSKARTSKRRAHDALKPATLGVWPQCHEDTAAHQICTPCGYYRGRQVREIKEA